MNKYRKNAEKIENIHRTIQKTIQKSQKKYRKFIEKSMKKYRKNIKIIETYRKIYEQIQKNL